MSEAGASSLGAPAEHSVAVPGGTIYYRTEGSGPPLVLIGGGPSNADTLRTLAGHLATGRTVITYDRRGYSAAAKMIPRSRQALPSTPATVRRGDIELFIHRDVPAIADYHLDLDRITSSARRAPRTAPALTCHPRRSSLEA